MSLLSAVFWLSAALVLYSYLIYPIALAVLAWLRAAPPVRKAPLTPSVSLVIVAHNEEAWLEAKLRNCLAVDYPREQIEIVVVSDGSTDRSAEIARSFAPAGVRLVEQPGPGGKPQALNAAIPLCRGELLVLCDARQTLAPDAVRALAANLADPAVGAVSGELHIAASASGSAAGEGVGTYWRYEKLIRRLQSRLGSTVGVTGALYALRRELYRHLDPRLILDDVAIPMEVVRAGRRVVFEPEARVFDQSAETPHQEYRRKVRTLAGNYQLVALRPWLLDPRRNPLFFHFVSHKLSRLLVPWCLVALLASSATLFALQGGAAYRVALLAQAAFYVMALLGWSLDRLKVRIPLLSVPYAFALLNLAAAASPFRFLAGRERAAWKASHS
jgi:cellulose synthase/poly-beta-1,6-N-acetylglucosamine synthase-like glycosyltransferase